MRALSFRVWGFRFLGFMSFTVSGGGFGVRRVGTGGLCNDLLLRHDVPP